MLRNTALTTLLLLSADVATTALAPVGVSAFTTDAAAADFTGRVKRIKIKKKRVGTGYKLNTRAEGTGTDTAATAEVTVRHADTGEVLETLAIDAPARARVFFSVQLAADASTDLTTYKVYPQLAEGSDADFSFDDAGYELDENGEAIAGAYKLRAKVTGGGELQVSVTSEDRDWDPDSITGVRVANAEGGPGWLSLDGIRHSFRADLDWGDDVWEDDLIFRTVLYDADGGIVDDFQQTLSPPSESDDPGIDEISVKETKKGVAKLVTWTTSDGSAAALEVELTDSTSGETVLYTVDDTPILTERTYMYSGLEFDPGEAPDGFTYLCLIDLIDDNGHVVGEQYEVEVVPPAVAEGEEYAVATVPFADGLGSVGLVNTGDGFYHVVGALWSDDARQASSFNLIFEEPFEGPAPLETEVTASIIDQVDKWVQKGEGAVPTGYDLTTTLTTAEGVVLETSTVSGGGTGTVFKDGSIVPGKVVSVGDKEVILNIGFKSEGNSK